MIGATARDIVLYHLEGIGIGRRTNDVDITVIFDSWEESERYKNRIRKSGVFRSPPTSAPHQVVHTATNYPLAIVPYGAIEQEPGVKVLTSERHTRMNATGHGKS